MAKQKAKRNHYQIKTSYRLQPELYKLIIYTIKHVYLNVLRDANDLIPLNVTESKQNITIGNYKQEVSKNDFGEVTKDPTGNLALNRTGDDDIVTACDDAWNSIPREYWDEVYQHIVFDAQYRYMDNAHENTYKRYVAQYVWFVARNLGRV